MGSLRQVARQPTAKDTLTAHARDERGILEITTARPVPEGRKLYRMESVN